MIIDPGVEVVLAKDVTMFSYGAVYAKGEIDSPIVFRGVDEDSLWNQLQIEGWGANPPISEFTYCHFYNARIALMLYVLGQIDNKYTRFEVRVTDCYFDKTVETGIYCWAQGRDASQYGTPRRRHAVIAPVIFRNRFESKNKGVEVGGEGGGTFWFAAARGAPHIQNNIFIGNSEAAFNFLSRKYSTGLSWFYNNTVIDCGKGVVMPSGYDAIIVNNVFMGGGTAITRTGTDSATVQHNCFHSSSHPFDGYPSGYGTVSTKNSNGTPCDFGFNIFENPQFLSETDPHLTYLSPCINAGYTGDDLSILDMDMDMDKRPFGGSIDIGADEFIGSIPIAIAGPNQVVCKNICDSIILNGSKSHAIDAQIMSYQWNLYHRENSDYNKVATGAITSVTFLESGIYDVELKVENDFGLSAQDTAVITVFDTCDTCSLMQGDLDSDGDVDKDDLAILTHYLEP